MRKGEKGFSLIELLIVVAIILIIAAIAIPNLLSAKIAANESAAASTVRTFNTAAQTYSSTWGNGYPPTQASMGGIPGNLATCDFALVIDQVLATVPALKGGYIYTYAGQGAANVNGPPNCGTFGFPTFVVVANPQTIGTTGQRAFCTQQDGVIRVDPTGGPIGATSAACNALQPIQ